MESQTADHLISTPHNPNEREQREIDLEISQLEDSIRALKLRRNTLSFISKLPCDILTTIFMEVLLDSDRPNSCSIVVITHVCQYWRQVAVNYPFLWSQITVIEGSKIYPELIARSNEVPVSVGLYSEGGEISNPPLLKVISANAHRIQELRVEGFGLRRVAREILGQFDKPALNLRTAQFAFYERNIELLIPSLSMFLGGYTPNLRKLGLDVAPINWDWLVCSHITELYIYGPRDPGIPLSVLRRMPNLQVLYSSVPLSDCPNDYNGSVSGPETVELEFLRKLTLHRCTFRNSWFFLDHLRFPPTTHLNLEMTFDIENAVRPLPQFCRQINRLRVSLDNCRFRVTSSSTFMELVIESSYASRFMNFLETFSTCSTLEFLTLRMGDGRGFGEFSWSIALAQMTHLISLDLDFSHSGRSLLRELTQSKAIKKRHSSPVFLPKLRQLILTMGKSNLSLDDAIDTLRNLLRARNNLGVRISEVIIDAKMSASYGWVADPKKIDELRSLVDVLRWDQERL